MTDEKLCEQVLRIIIEGNLSFTQVENKELQLKTSSLCIFWADIAFEWVESSSIFAFVFESSFNWDRLEFLIFS